MANQQNSYTGSQGTGTNNADFSFTFPSFTTSEVRVEVDNVVKTLTTHYTVENYNTTSGGKVRFTAGNIPTGTTPVRIFRETNVDSAKASFTAGSSLKAGEINDNFKQVLHALQESIGADATDRKIQTFNIEDEAVTSAKIKDLTIVDADIAAAAEIEVYKLKDGGANQVLVTQSDGTTVGWSSSVDLGGTLDVTGNVDFDANLNVDGTLTVAGAADLNGDLDVDGTTNLDNTNVAGYLNVVGTANIDNVFIDGNSVETLSGGLTLNSFSGSTTIDDNLNVTGTSTINNVPVVTTTATQTLTNKTLTTPVINDMSGTAVVTSGTSNSDTKVYSAKRAEERFYGKDTVGEIQSGETWSSADDKVATTAAIDARIIDLVDDVGGFVPIANETSFPTANPDVNNGAGTLISIKEISSTRTPSTGTVTIANGSGSNTVTITGCGSTVLTAGFGVIVETTTTLHTYAFHRLTPKATEVTTVAGKATEIGRLGTAAAVEDMSILGTTDVVADMNLLGTTDVVADMNMLATSDVISDMNTLAVTSVLNDMDTVATNVTNVNNVGGSIANVNTTAGSIANVNTVAGAIANVNTTAGSITNVNNVGGSIANVNSVASNLASVNSFANTYRIGADNPTTSLDVGDLFFNTTSDSLKVYTGSAWVDGVTATGNFAVVTGNTFTGSNNHNDNVKSIYGAGNDLQIYSTGTNGWVYTPQSGADLYMGTNAGEIYIVTGASGNDTGIKVVSDGSVELYEDNVKKAETTADGFNVEGILYANGIDMDDNHIAKIGLGDDLQIYHDGSTSYVSNTTNTGLLIRNLGNGDIKIKPQNSYPVELYYNGAKKFETTSYGAAITSSGSSHGLKVFHSNGNEVAALTHGGSGDEGSLILKDSNATTVVLRGENGTDIDITTGGNFDLEHDSAKLRIGAGNDLQIYHDGSNSYIKEAGTGSLKLASDSWMYMTNAAGSETILKAGADAQVELYYDNSKKLETTSQGVNLEGNGSDHYILDLHNTGSGKGSQIQFRNDHDASANIGIRGDTTGDFRIYTEKYFKIEHGGNTNLKSIPAGGIELYHNGSKKLETASDKINFYADAKVNAHNTYTLGADGARWRDLWIGNNIYLPDAGEVRLGNSGDLQLYHDGTNSYINDTGTGYLILVTSNLRINNSANNEAMIHANENGAVELYHDNSKKFETNSGGCTVTGTLTTTSGINAGNNISLNDGVRMKFGTGDDLQIVHDGNHSYIEDVGTGSIVIKTNELSVQSANGLENIATFTQDSVCKLYENSVLKFQTGSGGEYGSVEAKTGKNGWDGFSIGGYYAFMANNQGNADYAGIYNDLDNEWMFLGQRNGYIQLFYNGSEKIETTSGGAKVLGGLEIDGGTGNHTGDATLYVHANNNNDWGVIVDADSNGKSDYGLKVVAPTGAGYAFACAQPSGGSHALTFLIDGDGNVDKTGHIYPRGNNSFDLGSTSMRWRNIYTNDLNLSNEGSSNDVDGTWGDWTIQEGESDLFLKNNRSGKKYKFNLMEVS